MLLQRVAGHGRLGYTKRRMATSVLRTSQRNSFMVYDKTSFDVIDPKQFEKCFAGWVRQITKMKEGTVVAIDGKTMRGTDDEKSGKRAVHIVSAWCSENNLVMGQVKTKDKSNEITAIPELLDLLLIKVQL